MSDPYRNDQSRRYGAQGSNNNGQGFWPWLTAALTTLGLLIGGSIGYNWGLEHERQAGNITQQGTTTGAAPGQHR